jgi:hypothetical protein
MDWYQHIIFRSVFAASLCCWGWATRSIVYASSKHSNVTCGTVFEESRLHWQPSLLVFVVTGNLKSVFIERRQLMREHVTSLHILNCAGWSYFLFCLQNKTNIHDRYDNNSSSSNIMIATPHSHLIGIQWNPDKSVAVWLFLFLVWNIIKGLIGNVYVEILSRKIQGF